MLGTHVRKRRGEQPEQLGASKLLLVQVCWLQSQQTCAGSGVVATECLPDLLIDFGGLLKKLLFLGRTLLLRLWVFGRHVRKRLGQQPEQLGASKLVMVQVCWLQC